MTASTAESNSGTMRVALIIDPRLPANLAANAAAVLGASAGAAARLPIGADGFDAEGRRYPGIVTTPVPVLVADALHLRRLFETASEVEGMSVFALTEVARLSRSYEAYLVALAATTDAAAEIRALALAGPRNQVRRLTKRLALMSGDSHIDAPHVDRSVSGGG